MKTAPLPSASRTRTDRSALVDVCSNEDNNGPSPERRARRSIASIPPSTHATALQISAGPSLPAALGGSRAALAAGWKGMALAAAARRLEIGGTCVAAKGSALVASGMLVDGAAAPLSRSGST